MKPGRSGPLVQLRGIPLEAKQVSYTCWFACKHLNRKMKRALGINKPVSVWLPQEIVDYIVDYISDDRQTLFACTQLSRTWCIAARTHLHRTFTISKPSDFWAAYAMHRMGVIPLVRKMVATRKIDQDNFLGPDTMPNLNVFTHLQELDIRYLDVGMLVYWLRGHCDILKSTVRTLTLRYPKATVKQLVCLISLFSSLENLTVDSIDKTNAYDSQIPVIESSPPLTGRLTLTGIFDEEFVSALASLPNGVRFRVVDLQFCGEAHEIINACAETMERLTCHPSDFRDLKTLNLSGCTSLHHMEIPFHSIVRAFPEYPFADFISAIPSPELETCLILSYDNDLEELGEALRAAPKPKVKSVMTKEKEQPKKDVKIEVGLDIEKEGSEENRKFVEEALKCAIGNGVFDILKNEPSLEVYPRVWNLVV